MKYFKWEIISLLFPVTSFPVMKLPVMQLPVMHVHAITSGDVTIPIDPPQIRFELCLYL
jgi:hypothetical protein